MKTFLSIFSIIVLLAACDQKGTTTNAFNSDTSAVASKMTVKTKPVDVKREVVKDSLLLYDDSLFSSLNLNFIEVRQDEYESYKRKYKTECTLDSGHFIRGSGIYMTRKCNEICETYLCETTTNRKLLLPSNYDTGILTMLVSPDCSKLLVCSSYDGPDYMNYYEDRAEIFIFDVSVNNGLLGVKPAFKFYTKDWSVEDIIWESDKSIALKVYEEQRLGDGSRNSYKYYKTNLGE